MSWRRIAAYGIGGGLFALGAFVPAAGPRAMTAGAALFMWATNFPEKKKKKALPPPIPREAIE